MRQIKKIMAMFSICLSMALVVPCIAPTLSTSVTVEAATKVKLNKKKAYVTKGEKIQLKVSGTKKTVKWSSSNKKIATVSSKGTVKGLKKGTVTITAKVGDEKYTCKVTVESPKISESKVTVYKGKKITLSMKNTKQTVKWTSSNKKVATVNSKGSVKGIKKGTATITAKVGNKKYTCKITVKNPIALKSISLNKSKLTLEVDDEYQLKVKYNPSNTTVDKSVEWRSSNEDVIDVDEDGYLYAWDAGTATITAKVGGKKATCKVTVKEPNIEVDEIEINKEHICLAIGDIEKLNAEVFPENATNKTVSWSIDDDSVATINNQGEVCAVGIGKAMITATIDGVSTFCEVEVYDGKVYTPVACLIDFSYECAKFPRTVVFTNIYYTDDNGAGNELWLIEGYGENNFGGNSYFYVSAMRSDNVESYPLKPYKYYEISEQNYVRTVAYNKNPYSSNMWMFDDLNKDYAKNEYYSWFGDETSVTFE